MRELLGDWLSYLDSLPLQKIFSYCPRAHPLLLQDAHIRIMAE